MRSRYDDSYQGYDDREAPPPYDYGYRRYRESPGSARPQLASSRYHADRSEPAPTSRRRRRRPHVRHSARAQWATPRYARPGLPATGDISYGYAQPRPPVADRTGYGRLAFDAGDPGPPDRQQGWRRYLDEFSRRYRPSRKFSRHHAERETYPAQRDSGADDDIPAGFEQRGRRLARRYKEPIIGAAILGATLPFAVGSTGVQPGDISGTAHESVPIGEPVEAGHPTPKGSTEEEIGSRLATVRNDRARAATVDSAMSAYGISATLARQIYDAAVANDVEPELAFGLVKTESAFDQRAVSNVGARGLTQVMPRTARWLRPGTTIDDLYNRDINLNMGFGYLRDMINKYNGNVHLALLAYNRGPGTVDRVLDQGGDPDNGYADLVMEGYTDLG